MNMVFLPVKMDAVAKKPHVVCIPLPSQSHITVMLKLAKILHFKGFHITFVNTEFNHQRILMSRGADSLSGLPDFQFLTIPDGLPPSDINISQDILSLLDSIFKNGLVYVRDLIAKLNTSSSTPLVSCLVSDGFMTCTTEAAEELGIPQILLWPMSASTFMSFFHSQLIIQKDFSQESLDMPLNFIPGVKDIRVRDLPSFFWDGNHPLRDLLSYQVRKSSKASAIILNTFEELESDVLDAMKSILQPDVYTIGPLHILEQQMLDTQYLASFGTNFLKEHHGCLEWLDSRSPNSVLYVNFGSIAVMSKEQLVEFAWGIANSKHPFLWVIRPDLVIGEAAVLPTEFIEETAGRSMISGWCPQEEVLRHPSTAGFLTHTGWNSVMEAMCGGVPIICWPFFGDQRTNCRNVCFHWSFGLEIDTNVRREDVERIVRELMEGEKGKDMKMKCMEWKKKAEESTKPGGSSYVNLDKIITEMLLHNKLLH